MTRAVSLGTRLLSFFMGLIVCAAVVKIEMAMAQLTNGFVISGDAHIFTSPVARKNVINLGLTRNW